MSRYDATEALDFLEMEEGATPTDLYDEVCLAMHNLAMIENRRNAKIVDEVWHTLLTVADFLERIG